MDRVAYWNHVYELTDKYDLLQHPFYKAWRNGDLTREDLRDYASEYYHHVASFPGYLRDCAARLPDSELRQNVYRNLREEIGMEGSGERAHNLLWLDFALAAGADPGEVFNCKPIREITALIETFGRLATSGQPCQALAAFYIYESQVPRVAREKARTLKEIYGFDAVGYQYFTLHTTADVVHAQVWRDQLDELLKDDPDAMLQSMLAAKVAATALWTALDGIDRKRSSRLSLPS
jgi:pyrroloquinoline-quinone synthase